jgi:hypothetical protein
MKRIITFATLTALIAGYALADERTDTTGDSVAAVKDILIQIEHQWGDAMVKGDVPAFSQSLCFLRVKVPPRFGRCTTTLG